MTKGSDSQVQINSNRDGVHSVRGRSRKSQAQIDIVRVRQARHDLLS